MSDLKYASFLREVHEAACFETGEHPDEVTTAYSAAAEAIDALSAKDAEIAALRARITKGTTDA